GAAYVAWNGTYSFNFDARDIAIESVAALEGSPLPLSGILDFSAAGSGSVDAPTYQVRGAIRDLFAADEGIGQVVGTIEVLGDELTLKVEAASSRLAVSGSGRIGLAADMDAELTFTVADTSLDPYIRAYDSRLSPYTTAIASGTVRVAGKLADIDDVFVDATIDRFDARLFDYTLRNAAPIRIALDRHTVRIADMRLVGEGTELDVSGTVDLHDEWIAVRARGDANLAVLQGFVSNIRSTGRAMLAATLEGPLREPLVTGTMAIDNGRIRHFGAPHALENISGTVQFDSRSIRLDGLSARLGGGPVAFGGTIAIEGYRPGRLDVTVAGTGMRVRFPEGMTSRIDAQLALEGTADAAVLTGRVDVRDALYDREFNLAESLLEVGAGDALAPPPSSGPTIPLRYNVQINAPGTLQVANRSFNLLASANLQLLGTVDRPVLAGRAEVLRGEVIFEGRRYVVTRGTIDFTNPSRIEPFLDVEAETRVRVPGETYRVTIRATGTPDRLSAFTIDSDPPLPEYEVLALLFGGTSPGEDVEFRQYTSGETPQQALLRERMTRALTGVVSSEVGRVVEQTFGVDTFQLMPSLVDPNQQFSGRIDPAARVVIGKRLSDRVFLTYSRSLSSSTRDQIIVLEYDQTDRYSWIFSRNEDGTYALDVRVRRTF
ncbi:MAG TPA: translocation/assembly module TamB domain-containing protein, partial [Vicinamibacterales bacterium]|nr:translocation/assembly module TamB domain-containing protein [Vicinamibacterales bacterium]